MNQTRLCFLILLLAPLLVYWQSTFSEYGYKDDYSTAREAREEPGKLVRFAASHGRPLYGALLETSMVRLEEVSSLWALRLTTVMLFTVLGIGIWRQLYTAGWTEIEAAAVGLAISFLPGTQVLTCWAITWGHAVALVLGLAGFAAVETELERGGLKRAIAIVGGALIYGLAAIIYQSNALFAVVPFAGVLLVRVTRGAASDLRWTVTHVSTLFAGLMGAYLLVGGLFANGVFHPSDRMLLETNPFTKLIWFFSYPLPNALALFALRDDFNVGVIYYGLSAMVVVGLIFWGCKVEIARGGLAARRRVMVCVGFLPFLAALVSLAAAERAIGYRTIFALSGLVVVMVVFSLRTLNHTGKITQPVYYGLLGSFLAVGALLAHSNTNQLFAVPQNLEWETVRGAVMRAEFPKTSKIFLITPTPDDRITDRMYADEFGGVSGDSDWVPREMFKAALHERYPVKLPKGTNYTVTLGREEPDAKAYDLVIDLRKFKERAMR